MFRNQSSAWQTQELERCALSGIPFWARLCNQNQTLSERFIEEHSKLKGDGLEKCLENKSTFRVIEKLDRKKKEWIDLQENISFIANRLKKVEKNF